jgi:hypothetical protein
MKKWLFNPFIYVAGTRALLMGLTAMALTAFVGLYSHTHFDGAIDIHTGKISTLSEQLLEQLVVWGTTAGLFYLAGLLFSASSIRLVDVAGTMALARWVMIFPAALGFLLHVPASQPQTVAEIMKLLTPGFIAVGLLSLVFVIWMVALMYNAFTVSCNLKGSKATGTFIITLILAETISSLAIHYCL